MLAGRGFVPSALGRRRASTCRHNDRHGLCLTTSFCPENWAFAQILPFLLTTTLICIFVLAFLNLGEAHEGQGVIIPLTTECCSPLHPQIVSINDQTDEIAVIHDWRTSDANSTGLWPFNPKTNCGRKRTTQLFSFASSNPDLTNVVTPFSPQRRKPIIAFHKLYYNDAFNNCGFRIAGVYQKIFDRFGYLIDVPEYQSRPVTRDKLGAGEPDLINTYDSKSDCRNCQNKSHPSQPVIVSGYGFICTFLGGLFMWFACSFAGAALLWRIWGV